MSNTETQEGRRRPAWLHELVHEALDDAGAVTATDVEGDTRYAHALQAVDGIVYRATIRDDPRIDSGPEAELAHCHPRSDVGTLRGWSKVGVDCRPRGLGNWAQYFELFQAAREEFETNQWGDSA